MQLPDALHPWQHWLNQLDPATWPVFAQLLGRIEPLLGPLRGGEPGGAPEPDGLADLQRRGSYDRLLSSEWLLAEEMPDEFLRRAVTREHLFLAPELRARQSDRRIVALFDAGPLQWGAPRLVHLAMLILLERRAAVGGAQLFWGVAQRPGALGQLNDIASLKGLLGHRTQHAVSEQDHQAWQALLANAEWQGAETWLIGSDEPGRYFDHRMQIRRSLDGQHLGVTINGANRRSVSLPVPAVDIALRLLKGEFGTVSKPAPRLQEGNWRVALTSAPVISPHGTYVALMLLDEPGCLVFRVPQAEQKKAQMGRRQYWRKGLHPVAATFVGNHFGAVLSEGTQLHFWRFGTLRHAMEKPSREQLLMPLGTAALLPSVVFAHQGAQALFCQDKQGRLVHVHAQGRNQTVMRELSSSASGLAQVSQESLAYLEFNAGRLFMILRHAAVDASVRVALGQASAIHQVFFAGTLGRRPSFVPCAVQETKGGDWRIHENGDNPQFYRQVKLAANFKVVGLLLNVLTQRCGLVLIGTTGNSVSLYVDGHVEPLLSTAAPIARHSFCTVSGLLALLTEQRELLVLNVRTREVRLQVSCRGKREEVADD